MMEISQEAGLSGLFIVSFLAATLLPLGSEVFLLALQAKGFAAPELLLVAGCGNVLGSCLNYVLGRYAGIWVITRIWRVSALQLKTAQQRMGRYGYLALLLAWVPVIGDPLTFVAGLLKLHAGLFLLLVAVGKFTRYALLLLVFA